MTDLCWTPVRDLAQRITTKEVSPVEVVRAHLERIHAHDGRLRSFITVLADEATEAARRAEADLMAGRVQGPLHGVPIGLKDLFETAGVKTTGGSKILGESVPVRDATVVAKLKAAGAIVLGKLNMHEFAYGPEGLNAHYGTPRNPWDATAHRIPGGSYSGSGVAVAAGLVPGALGSDTGGSIRIPAALCGITGLKPTYGRVSRAGVLPLAWSMDHVGPMARTAADCALLLRCLAGPDPLDTSASVLPVPDYVGALTGEIKGLRVGLLRKFFLDGAAPARRGGLRAPTTPMGATVLGQTEATLGDGMTDVRSALTRLTRPFNFSGHPACSVPCGFSAAGLPIGMQFVGRPFDEATVLRSADAYQRATDWHARRPVLACRPM